MGSRYIITTRWWTDSSAARVWPLLADAPAWPLWWKAIAEVQTAHPPRRQGRWPWRVALARQGRWPWRVALGQPLRLAVSTLASQPPQWLTLRLHGDLQGQATITLESGTPSGLDITCRCELQASGHALRPWALVFEHRLRGLLRQLATDLGQALQGQVRPLGTWQGRWQHGDGSS